MSLFKHKENTTEEIAKSTSSFFRWVQEYSKKIVSITFFIFVLINLYILAIVAYAYFQSGELACLDTLITEANQTFRDVIGGYIIKAAAENTIKISGGIVEKYMNFKMEKDYGIKTNVEEVVEDEEYLDEEETNETDDPEQ